ncbi:MAG: PTS sugar transporter subunit IIA [Deltaproteobacteria bacterium]|nr:PTS sugar transporter subunit IIA [Deltaproteobacteria bacterium]
MYLTIDQVSKWLNLPVNTLQRWVRQGKIPVYKSDNGYVFLERELKDWADSRGIFLTPKQEARDKADRLRDFRLTDAMKKGGTIHEVKGEGVSGVLKAVVQAAPLDRRIDRDVLFRRLIEREELSSTGIGEGIAIPHPRFPLADGPEEPSITTAFLDSLVDYGSIDGVPVFVLFLMLSPSPKVHLTLLGKLSHLLKDASFKRLLKQRPVEQDLLAAVEATEINMDPAGRVSGSSHVG